MLPRARGYARAMVACITGFKMGRSRAWGKLLLGVVSCSAFAGCLTLDLSGGWNNGTDDPLQAEIFKQYKLAARPGWWKPDSAIVLAEIPAGTPLPEAHSVMQRHGFQCSDGLSDEQGTYLHCTAYRRTGRKTCDRISVKVYDQGGRVTDIDVTTYYDVP